MATVKVNPRLLRRVGRIFKSQVDSGLKALQAIGDVKIWVVYCPVNKLFFLATLDKVYPYYYTNDYNRAVRFGLAELNKLIPEGHPQVMEVSPC